MSRVRAAALLAVAAVALSACGPAAEPTPTPTAAFASEEEAFAAAEETYRAYNDALEQVDTTDPTTFAPLYELTAGGVNASDRESFSELQANGYTVHGRTEVVWFEPMSASPSLQRVTAQACLDVSKVEVQDANGTSQVNPDRPDIYALELTFVLHQQQMLLEAAKRIDEPSCDG